MGRKPLIGILAVAAELVIITLLVVAVLVGGQAWSGGVIPAAGGGGSGSFSLITGKTTATITASRSCHPSGPTPCTIAGDIRDRNSVPMAGSFDQLRAFLNQDQQAGDECDIVIATGACTDANLVDSTVVCSIDGVNDSCSDLANSVTVAAGDCYEIHLIEQLNSCNAIWLWSFRFTAD